MATGGRSSDQGAGPEATCPRARAINPSVFDNVEISLSGRLTRASNATFLGEFTTADGVLTRCVYKPIRGERPLWDFPDGTLAARELAAYRISTEAGFDLVPATVLADGPLGPGSLQAWIDEDDTATPMVDLVRRGRVPAGCFPVVEGFDQQDRPVVVIHRDDPDLRRMALFDAVINNSDRKGAHILRDADRRLWAIDHGVSLHAEDKLRTVLWGWAGDRLTAEERDLVTRALGAVDELTGLVTEEEQEAYEQRCLQLLAEGILPLPAGDWPSIPWPPL